MICILVTLLLGGCGSQKSQQGQNPTVQQGKTIRVTDFVGRKVAVPVNPQRIACLYAYIGHVVTMLGKGDKIVAVVAGLKRDVLLNQLNPQIAKAAVPVSSGTINFEELVKAKPDVIFVKGSTVNDAGEMEKLNKSGIPFVVVDYRNMKEQQASVKLIGEVVGEAKKAAQYNRFYQDCIVRVQKVVSKIPENQKVRLYHSVMEATRTDGPNSLPADWTKAAGAINVSVNQNLKLLQGETYASLEQILLWNPDVIIVNEPGVGNYLMTNPQWSALSAVKHHKVYQMPIGISRWGHPGGMETPLAILWTAKKLYPDRFTDLDLQAITTNFYKQFFNYKVSHEEVIKILNSEGMRVSKQQQQ